MKVVQGAKFIRENAAGKLPRHAMARHTVGSNIKNPPNIRLKKFVKLADHTILRFDIKDTIFEFGHFRILSGHFFANYI